MNQHSLQTDVFIIGGGPAGLAAAIAARRKGLAVTVADFARPPINKACGEGLMPDAVRTLTRLGVSPAPGDAVAFKGIRFIEGETCVAAAFPNGYGLGVRREILHQILVQRANELGVSVLWGTPVHNPSRGRISLDDSTISCRWIVGADGQNSRARKWANLDHHTTLHLRFGFRRHFRVEPWADYVEVHWGKDCQIVVTPVRPNEVCLALVSRNPKRRIQNALSQFPHLQRRLSGARPTTEERGGISASRRLKAVSRDPFLLVGDASGSIDAISGEGLCQAFQQAAFLADALEGNDLGLYESAHQSLARLPMLMARLMLLMDEHTSFRHRVMRTLAAHPALFSRLLAIHVGALAPAEFGLRGAVKLGWQFLTL